MNLIDITIHTILQLVLDGIERKEIPVIILMVFILIVLFHRDNKGARKK